MTCNVTYKYKTGATIRIPFQLKKDGVGVDITGWTIKAEIRYGSKLYGTFQIVPDTPSQGSFVLLCPASDTKDFPNKPLESDVQFIKPSGDVVYSPTFILDTEKGVTVYV